MNPTLPVTILTHHSRRAAILLAGIGTLAGSIVGRAGDGALSSGAFTGDADSGVSSAKTYITRANIIGGDVIVNGVTLIGSGSTLSGTGWSLTGAGNEFASGGNHTTTFGASTIDDLFDGFQYNGNPATLTMSGLTPGQTYTVTLYNQAWTLPDRRISAISTTEGASFIYNQDAVEASLLRYTFVASGTSTDLAIAPRIAGNTFHFYGVTNEQVFTNTWSPTAGTSWNTAANWSSGTIPNSAGSNASFSAQAGATNVTLASATTTGHIEFLGSGGYTISGANTLTLQADTGGSSVVKGDAGVTNTISAPLQMNSPLAKFGAGTLRITGTIAGSGNGVTIGSGTLAIETSTADLSGLGNVANSGTLQITNAGSQSLEAIITGTGGFEKRGAGTFTLGGYQEYGGPTLIQSGTLKLAPATSLTIENASFETYDPLANGNFGYSPTGATWAFDSAGIGLNGSPWFNPTNHDGIAGGFIQQGGGSISQTIQVATAGLYNFTFDAVSRGGGLGPNGILFQVDGVTMRIFEPAEFSDSTWRNYAASVNLLPGTHTITFAGNNFLGGDRSTVIDSVAGATGGRLPANSAVTLASASSVLDLSGVNQTIGSLSGVVGSTVINNNTSLTAGGDNTNTTFSGVISGTGSFTKAGNGVMQWTAPQNYSGSTTIAGGTIQLVGVSLPTGTALNLTGAGASLISNGIALVTSAFAGVGGTTVNIGSGALTVGDATSTSFAGSLVSGPFTKQGTGNLTLAGPIAYSGGATIAAGTLKTESANTGTIGTMNIAAGATWDLATSSQAVAGLTGAGTIIRTSALSTGLDGAALINPSKNYLLKLDFGDSDGAVVNGVAFDTAGTSGVGFNLTGAGNLFGENAPLTGYDKLVNDFYYNGNPGTLTFDGLTIGQTYEAVLYTKVGHWGFRPQDVTFDEDAAGPLATQLLNTDPGNVGYYAYKFVAPTTAMSVSVTPANPANTFHWFAASLESVSIVTPTLTVGDAGNYSFSGAITGPTRLIKQGSGIQELSGASDFTGSTEVNAGTLFVTGSLSGTLSVAVNGGTLGGSGSINPAATVTVAGGGSIEPGNSIGTLLTGPVSFANTSILAIEVGATTSDELGVTGAASINGIVTLTLSLLADPVDNTVFTLIDGTAPLLGYAQGGRFQFGANVLDEGELFSVTTGIFTQEFRISYLSDGGNDLALTAVPEPVGCALLLLGGTALAGRRRRRA